ncbi:LrgB family protein [Lederbergia wuyishanensis]|uniref:Murein hydrolase (TIGR00659 family) n=1 Tax=Lederbergia wuyishanensis TaxID=1347903 RepID=A0ABU0D6S6_9BACI|nr:LrgB family protein [Lederbergia wuyishanensis]MCJ8008795.1 LrgB family protein [Lederbergia wuyishanensis]MDQ0344116.1 putative murein hydrolase (TIGR00659 family) [Lederbergia wuyishanensis]
MNDILIGLLAVFVTFIVFFAAKTLSQKFPHPLTLPVLTSTIVLVIGLLLFRIPYETYFIGGKWIEGFLGPAVVALAYPLYQHRKILREYTFPILIGTFFGSVLGVTSSLVLGKWIGLDHILLLSVLPKSVTSPIAMDIAASIGGSPTLAAVLVMVAGIGGAVMGHSIFRWVRIDHHLAKGLGMGSASHAIGTARSMENDLREGAASTVAMVLSAIFTSVITPIIVAVLL